MARAHRGNGIACYDLDIAVFAKGLSAGELARRLNWVLPTGRADDRRVAACLGRTVSQRDGRRQYVTYETAEAICTAAHIDPLEVGL